MSECPNAKAPKRQLPSGGMKISCKLDDERQGYRCARSGGHDLPTSCNDARMALIKSASWSYAAAKTKGQPFVWWSSLVVQISQYNGAAAFAGAVASLSGILLLPLLLLLLLLLRQLLLLLLLLLLTGTLGVIALGVGILHDPLGPVAATAEFGLGACTEFGAVVPEAEPPRPIGSEALALALVTGPQH